VNSIQPDNQFEAALRRMQEQAKKRTPVINLNPVKEVTVCGWCGGETQQQGKPCAKCAPGVAAKERAMREKAWLAADPPFEDTVLDRLPCQEAVQKVMDHPLKDSVKGLQLMGPTGQGKSRVAWYRLKKEALAGRSVAVMDSDASLVYASKFKGEMDIPHKYYESLAKADVLLLDDTFKCKFTDGFENFVFTVINYRTARSKPCIITCNDTLDSLQPRMSGDRGEPLVRRLREFCVPVVFCEGGK